ncbi:putative alpha,alpha-trehalose-phosphate synthase (UDP-forming) [Lupinus albus]|uniref:Putative alpha,alpha-trehalose-phosphate synthase (UDP-forming) n=1 Tax=Lupinus albus TaxID=3870 RepID=A0A6A4R5W7_LUPAL|nr:putative alpha,alpha-trehalose-phosphate synthase (UDP-forming) [Lupinus albus]
MPGNKYNGHLNNHIPGRVERLLRNRELRKSSRESYLNENEQRLREDDDFYDGDECFIDGAKAARMLAEMCQRQGVKQRLLVVANRLPVSAVRKGEDSWSLEISAGGLVSALLGVKEFETRWIGWAGVNVPDEVGQEALTKALAEKVPSFWLSVTRITFATIRLFTL